MKKLFESTLQEIVKESFDLKHLAKKVMSKMRGALRVFGLVNPIETKLIEYPELGELYMALVLGEDPFVVEGRLREFLAAKPEVLDELIKQAKKNIYDLNTEYLEDALELYSNIEDDPKLQDKAKEILDEYRENKSEKVLRIGLENLLKDEMDTMRKDLASGKSLSDVEASSDNETSVDAVPVIDADE